MNAGPKYSRDGTRVEFWIANMASSGSLTLQTISLSWDGAYRNLKKVQLGVTTVWKGSEPPSSAVIGTSNGTLAAGAGKALAFRFARSGRGAPVAFAAAFSDGCGVSWKT